MTKNEAKMSNILDVLKGMRFFALPDRIPINPFIELAPNNLIAMGIPDYCADGASASARRHSVWRQARGGRRW